MKIDEKLTARLQALPVQTIDELDNHTLVLRGVPVNPEYFPGASGSNLLLKALQPAGRCWMVYCDESLRYEGPDVELTRAFATGETSRGWRRLFVHAMRDGGIAGAIERALRALGAEGDPPHLALPLGARRHAAAQHGQNDEDEEESLLQVFGTDLTAAVEAQPVETVGQEDRALALLTCFSRAEDRAALLLGAAGVGKTNLIWAAVQAAAARGLDLRFIRMDVPGLFAGALFDAEREKMLTRLLSEAGAHPEVVLVLEHMDLVLREAPHAAQHLAGAIDRGQRLLGTALKAADGAFAGLETLARRLQCVVLAEPDFDATEEIVRVLLPRLAEYHGVDADATMARAALAAAAELPGCFPAKAVRVLDTAAARAALSNTQVIGLDDIYAASRCFEAVAEGSGAAPGYEDGMPQGS